MGRVGKATYRHVARPKHKALHGKTPKIRSITVFCSKNDKGAYYAGPKLGWVKDVRKKPTFQEDEENHEIAREKRREDLRKKY